MTNRKRLPIENELVPYVPSVPPGRRWLVLAPHPDDELFGAGATIADGIARGVTIAIVIVTDGRAQGDAAERAAEARVAAQRLGVPSLFFWGFPDRSLDPADPALRTAIRAALDREQPDAVFVTGPVDLHPDHRALALALQRELRRRTWIGLRSSQPEWVISYEIALPILPNLLVSSPIGWARKLEAGAAYASQLRFRPYDRMLEAMGTLRALTLEGCEHAEAFFVLPATHVARMSARRWAALLGSPRPVVLRRPT